MIQSEPKSDPVKNLSFFGKFLGGPIVIWGVTDFGRWISEVARDAIDVSVEPLRRVTNERKEEPGKREQNSQQPRLPVRTDRSGNPPPRTTYWNVHTSRCSEHLPVAAATTNTASPQCQLCKGTCSSLLQCKRFLHFSVAARRSHVKEKGLCKKCLGREFGSFLHYAGIVVLKDRIGRLAYEHFKLLYCAVTILSSWAFKDQWEYAGTLLRKFVEDYSVVYDRIHLVSNVHLLLHVYEEVNNLGPLITLSTHSCENMLQIIKHSYVKSGYRSLHQAIGKIILLRDIDTAAQRNQESMTYPTLKVKKDETILQVRQGFLLRKNFKDSWFLTKRNIIVKYEKAIEESGSVVVHGYPLVRRFQAFTTPIASDKIYNYIGYENDISTTLRSIPITDIKCKMVAIKTIRTGAKVHFTPLIHTLT